ncbi:hypothetical protein PF004_g13519 [Phytophthora fragariae]|uniref:Uncharacterized protein n=1 Tax=Phytophthora fragariae TaxID=53985 RepID=A0A6G0NRW1_9STRA|nr:hypothetical protein PF004_g13519 [Phytophthora fragariae]
MNSRPNRLSERRYCGTQRCLSAAVVARDSSCELVRPMSLLYHKRCTCALKLVLRRWDSYQKMNPALQMLTYIDLALDAIDSMSKSTETQHRSYSSKSGAALSACAVMASPSTRTNGIL